ncbi:MAG: hypothetical protein E6J52_10875 [Chloroflexi bacterium]|nr:MAG: hypothetical protein E6J52_10875 [Chloroflexota bacterium]
MDKKERLEAERSKEQREGLAASRRGTPAAESDKPENHPPHPQDVNEVDYGKRKPGPERDRLTKS